jgi:hypothetical protein
MRFAIGTCIVALILAMMLSGESSERLATAAYLAAIFAAVTLAAQRFVGADPSSQKRAVRAPTFPSALGYSIAVAIFLSALTGLASAPAAEALMLVACAALVVAAILIRSGALAAPYARFVRDGRLVAATQVAVVACLCALGLAALSGDAAWPAARVAYRLMVIVTLLLAVSLLGRAPVAEFARQMYARVVKSLDRQAQTRAFRRGATYAAIAGVIAMVLAGLLRAPLAEPFAVSAYLAATAAAFAVAMECRRLRG